MFEIIETRNSYGNCYKMNTYNDNKIITTNEIQIKSFNSFVDDKCIIMLYSSSMQPIDNAIDFLNWGMNNASENYILQSITALKLLHSYLEIFNVSLDNMDKKQALGFLDFIKGMSHEGFLYTTKLTTIRKNESVSCYLKVIRKYIEFLGYDNHVLLKRTNISRTILLPETDSAKTINTYFINVKTNKKDYVPAYINIDEYKRIIDIINKSYTLRDKVIVRLMYEHGLRLGEVLGLTLEDFKQKENNDFLIEYSVELRNRLTDTREQKAKTCMKVFSDFDYKDKNYKSEGVGYHKLYLVKI